MTVVEDLSVSPREKVAGAPADGQSSAGLAVLGVVLAGIAVVFGVVAMGLSSRDGGSSGNAVATTPKAKVVSKVTLTDFKISASPSTWTAGPALLELTNKGPSPHNITIDGMAKSAVIAAGQKTLLSLGTVEAGTYTWYCSIAGHREAGMSGTFTVTGTAPASAASDVAGATPSAAAADTTLSVQAASDKIDTAHKEVVAQFLSGPPAKTAGLGGQLLAPTIENGVKVFNLTAEVVQWEVAPGKMYEAWTYNGVVPGPQIRVKQGETVKVRLKNKLPQSTSIHWHGLEIADNKQDGVTFVTQDPIKPGATYEYTLTPLNCGSHMYHSHHAADAQVPLGLLGAFVVDCTTTPVPAFAAHDTEYTEILSDGPLGFSINGKGFPATAPIVAKVGEKTLVRFMNEGLIIHPMHLHGHRMTVIAKDGNFLPAPYEVDTLNIAPGERYDVIVTSLYPGVWAFHCHILTHAESDAGLHGMTTVWIVKP